jgi:site-specific recombinase XerD
MNTTFNLELNRKPGRNGLYEIFLRITQNRNHKRIKLGVPIPDTNQWGSVVKDKKGKKRKEVKFGKWINSKNKECKTLNKKLEDKYNEAKNRFYELEAKKQSTSLQSIKAKINNPETSHSFFAFAKNQLDLLSNSKEKSYSFEKHFRSVIFKGQKSKTNNNLQGYAESKGFNDLLFSDITLGFLREYESFLSGQGNRTNTIHKKMGFIKALYNEAIKQRLINPQDSPFISYEIKKKPVSKDKLSLEEIQKIEELQLPEGTLIWHSRNMFLFSFYQAGMRASDCIKLTWGNVIEGRLIYYMDKNEKPLNLKIMPKAEEILNLYRRPEANPKDYIFPLLDNRKDFSDRVFLFNQVSSKNALINKYLRKIADKAEIKKKLSFHIARHSFASIAKNEKKLSTEMISELLNHSSLAITKAYLQGFGNEDMDKSLESVTG